MARYDKDHKRLSRERIIEAAGRRFKTDGIDGSGVAVLMKDAGLTNGAFYGHFESKDDLVSSAVREELQAQRQVLAGLSRASPAWNSSSVRTCRSSTTTTSPADVRRRRCWMRSGDAPTAPDSPTATASCRSSTISPPVSSASNLSPCRRARHVRLDGRHHPALESSDRP